MFMRRFAAVAVAAACVASGADAQQACEPVGDVEFVCGPVNAEDLVLAPGTDWIISSGMTVGSNFYAIDSATGAWHVPNVAVEQDSRAWPGCPAAPDFAELETHGLNVRETGDRQAVLYAVGHGAREAIEVFELDGSGSRPAVTWVGCVPMPDGLAANSVASFDDGSLVATVLIMPGKTFADSIAMRPTGAVFKWEPGDAGFTLLEGSELPGNNGIEVSEDGDEIYVVSSGFQTIVAFSNTNPVRQLRTTAQLPITPDNVHMSADGRLLTAGMKNDVPECGGAPGPDHDLATLATCPRGSIAIEVDPETMEHRILAETPESPLFSNATMVLTTGDRFWIGTFAGERVAHGPLRPLGWRAAGGSLPADVDPESLSRLPALHREDLDEEGKAAWDLVVGDGPRPLTGPAAVSMYSPKIAEAFHILNQYLRGGSVFEQRDYEVAILLAAREFDQAYEWAGHEAAARRVGVPEAVIDTIRYDREIGAMSHRDALMIRFGRALFREHAVSAELYAEVIDEFGQQGMVELATIMGDYLMVGLVLTAVDQHVPPGREDSLPRR